MKDPKFTGWEKVDPMPVEYTELYFQQNVRVNESPSFKFVVR